MPSEVLRVEHRGRAALLTIDRPQAGNSISAEVTTALDEAITERVLLDAYHLPRHRARRLAKDDFVELWLSEDHREAEAAFAAKRPPIFKGK